MSYFSNESIKTQNKEREKSMSTKQAKIFDDLIKLEKEAYDIDTAKINKIVEMTNHQYYNSTEYEKRNGLLIECISKKDGDLFKQWFAIPESPKGYKHTPLYKFKEKYGKYPIVGLDVETKIDEKGFWRIVLS